MLKENQIIDLLKLEDLNNGNTVHLINCIIHKIDLIGAFELNVHLKLENCIINSLEIHSCWFVKGLILKNCVVISYVDYQMGGHNLGTIIIDGNVFNSFVNFFDCQFESRVEIRNNVFQKGTNLFGNKEEGFENTFVAGWLAEKNVGALDVDQVEE